MTVLDHEVFGKASSPGLVCVNGLGAPRRSWWPLVRHFIKTHRVLLYDHRGARAGSLDTGLPSLADYRSDLVDLVEATGFAGATFLGFSFGGRVCIDLALARPELVGALVLVSTAPGGIDTQEIPAVIMDVAWRRFDVSSATWAREVMPTLFGPDYLQRHDRVLMRLAEAGAFELEDPDAMARQWLAISHVDVRAQLGAIRCPCLVVQGEADQLCPPHKGSELADRIPGARLRLYPGLGHVPHLEQPSAIAEELRVFLRSLPRTPGHPNV